MESLSVKNFKKIKSLKIDGIERVNLFTGKNNTGKSSLLEAVALYVNQGDFWLIRQILEDRGELNTNQSNLNFSEEQQNIDALSSLFTDRQIKSELNNSIIIRQKSKNQGCQSLALQIVKFHDETIQNTEGEYIKKRKVILDYSDKNVTNFNSQTGLQIRYLNGQKLIPLKRDIFYSFATARSNSQVTTNFQYIKSGTSTIKESSQLWDNITLTEKEINVIEGLKIIEPSIERLAFIGKSSHDRTAVVKLKGNKQVTKLQGMGDGINRILAIILAAVNAENGYLLIDEFENGLHYSVQKQLWEIIFKLASELNIQVFATTHSNDCIDGFEEVLNSQEYNITGKLFRLEKDGDEIKNVAFDKNELKIATEADIETR